jgi:hypothetical protein
VKCALGAINVKATGLGGPYSLTTTGIDGAVQSISAGAYALGKMNDSGIFVIHRVGRSDTDVGKRLKDYVKDWYPEFLFGYLNSAKAAFEKECHLYHDFSPPDNFVHPDRPDGSNWKCPRCTIYD